MPKKSKQQKTGASAEAKFQSIIEEKGWNYRDQAGKNDFGIDGEIEVVDEDGEVTGNLIKVQVKGAIEPNYKVQFEIDKLQYYFRHAIPVLLVRYVISEDQFYYMWAQEALKIRVENQQSVTLTFEKMWSQDSFEEIKRYYNVFKALRSKRYSFPIKFNLDFEDIMEILGVSRIQLELDLNELFSGSNICRIETNASRNKIIISRYPVRQKYRLL